MILSRKTMQRKKRLPFRDPLRHAYDWLCECGERGGSLSPSWRWNGLTWEHHHGYPIGHVAAQYKPLHRSKRRKPMGFATFTRKRMREIASLGGTACAKDREHMALIGAKGGKARKGWRKALAQFRKEHPLP